MNRFSKALALTVTGALSSAALSSAALAAAALPPPEPAFRAIYQEMVETNTTLSVGDCSRITVATAAKLAAAGYPAADVQIIAPADRPTKSNIVAILHGSQSGQAGQSRRAILLLAHIDVVEAKREDWVRDPFKLVEEDGYFYGRGTADDKSMAAIFVDAMLRYKQSGYRPKRDIKLALTCGEETPNDFDGAKYLAEHHRDLIDAELALNEGGGGRMSPDGKLLYNGVQAGEKVYQDYRLEITNPGGHSSRPVPDNAIYRLAAALTRLQGYAFPIQFNDATRGFFARMAKIEAGQSALDMPAVLRTPPDAAALARLQQNPSYNAILHTTCVATLLDGGHAPNGLPQRAGANVNCRIFPGVTQESVRQTLEHVVADPGIKVSFVDAPEQVSPAPPLTRAILGPIEAITEAMWPGVPVVPSMAAGATDGRFLTPAGIPTYGVSGIFSDPATTNAHGLNERVRVQSLYEGREFLDRLIKAYADRK